METAVGAAVLPGLALGGVLAVAGAWSRLARGAALPHLGVGALAGVLALVSLRLIAQPGAVALPVVVVLGGAAGLALSVLDARVRALPEQRPMMADLAVLAALLALAAALRPSTAIPLPFGPLGGQPGPLAAAIAASLAVAGTALLGAPRVGALARPVRWGLAGALLGAVVVLAAGGLSATQLAFGGIIGLPDTAGLALRAAAVGLAARRDALDAIAAGLVLGVAETILAGLVPLTGAALVPTAAALVVGIVLHVRGPRVGV